jgi:hypothetical protein
MLLDCWHMDTEDAEKAITKILDEASAKVCTLADAFRTDTLLPFCRQHELTYMAGNGITAFYNRKGDSVDEIALPELRSINATLNIHVMGTNDVLGFYVADVRKSDLIPVDADPLPTLSADMMTSLRWAISTPGGVAVGPQVEAGCIKYRIRASTLKALAVRGLVTLATSPDGDLEARPTIEGLVLADKLGFLPGGVHGDFKP